MHTVAPQSNQASMQAKHHDSMRHGRFARKAQRLRANRIIQRLKHRMWLYSASQAFTQPRTVRGSIHGVGRYIQSGLDGKHHARFQHPRSAADLIVADIMHIQPQPVAGSGRKETPPGLLGQPQCRLPPQQAQAAQSLGQDPHRRAMGRLEGPSRPDLIDHPQYRRSRRCVPGADADRTGRALPYLAGPSAA